MAEQRTEQGVVAFATVKVTSGDTVVCCMHDFLLEFPAQRKNGRLGLCAVPLRAVLSELAKHGHCVDFIDLGTAFEHVRGIHLDEGDTLVAGVDDVEVCLHSARRRPPWSTTSLTGAGLGIFAAVMAATRLTGDGLIDRYGPVLLARCCGLSRLCRIGGDLGAPNVPVALVVLR